MTEVLMTWEQVEEYVFWGTSLDEWYYAAVMKHKDGMWHWHLMVDEEDYDNPEERLEIALGFEESTGEAIFTVEGYAQRYENTIRQVRDV